MSLNYLYDIYSTPESEYYADELKKRLQCSLANFAQRRFIRAMELRIAIQRNEI